MLTIDLQKYQPEREWKNVWLWCSFEWPILTFLQSWTWLESWWCSSWGHSPPCIRHTRCHQSNTRMVRLTEWQVYVAKDYVCSIIIRNKFRPQPFKWVQYFDGILTNGVGIKRVKYFSYKSHSNVAHKMLVKSTLCNTKASLLFKFIVVCGNLITKGPQLQTFLPHLCFM